MTKKKLFAALVAVIMVLSAGTLLVACDLFDRIGVTSKSFTLDWNQYLVGLEYESDTESVAMPDGRSLTFSADTVSTINKSYGLVNLSATEYDYWSGNTYRYWGYSIAGDTTFGRYDNLTKAVEVGCRDTNAIVYVGTTSNDKILYDALGEQIWSSSNIYVSSNPIAVVQDGTMVYYVEVSDYYYTRYYRVQENGGLDSWDYTTSYPTSDGTIDDDVEPEEKPEYPQYGDKLSAGKQTLAEYFGLETSSYGSSIITSIKVEESGRDLVFYNGSKKLSTWTKPLELSNYFYVGGAIMYTTSTPVDPFATKGYNLFSGGDKYNVETFAFDIEAGKTTKLKTDYVITGNAEPMYNHYYERYDAVQVEAVRTVDGIAWAGEQFDDVLVINAAGEIGFSKNDSPYGVPYAKLNSNNFLAKNEKGTYLVSSSGEIVAAMAGSVTLESIQSDAIYLRMGSHIGAIDFSGTVAMSFDYEVIGSIGNLRILRDGNGSQYVLNVSESPYSYNNPKSASQIVYGSSEASIVYNSYLGTYLIRTTNSYSGTYNWYNLNGYGIVQYTESSTLTSSAPIYINGHWYMFNTVSVAPNSSSTTFSTEYLRIAL